MAERKVLVVDDDGSMRGAIERLLGAAGIATKTYQSAEDLLANGAAATADCIVSDWQLPAANGLEMFDAIHARGWKPPMILITAHDSPGLRGEAKKRGVAGYLVKPFRGKVLLEAITAATGAPRPAG